MENLIFTLLIIIPGALMVGYMNSRLPKSRRMKTQIEELATFTVAGVIIMAITLSILRFNGYVFVTVSSFMKKIQNIDFILIYSMTTIPVLYSLGWILSNDKITTFQNDLRNIFRKLEDIGIVSKYATVWDEVFENPTVPIKPGTIVQIIKNGQTVTQGHLTFYNGHNAGSMQLKIEDSTTYKTYFDFDYRCNNVCEQYFNEVLFEIYDMDKDVLIKFYDPEKFKERQIQLSNTSEKEKLSLRKRWRRGRFRNRTTTFIYNSRR